MIIAPSNWLITLNPVKDFDVMAPLFRTYFFVGVPANSPYRTVGDILADAKARPGVLNHGSWSVGNPVHLGSALLESMTGTQMQHVIYKETSMLYAGVANGELNWSLGSLAPPPARCSAPARSASSG